MSGAGVEKRAAGTGGSTTLPTDRSPEAGIHLLREGYRFIPNRCRRFGSDLFEARMMLQRVICMSGVEAAREFYVPGRFTRRKALPPTVLTLLQDYGSAATLDGEEHRHRKHMFLETTAPGRFDQLLELAAAEWRSAAERWQRRSGVILHRGAEEVLCRAVCSWAGVPVADHEVVARTNELALSFDGPGSVGTRQLRAQVLRHRSELWIRGVVDGIREGRINPPKGSPAEVICAHTGLDGDRLDRKVAGVELLNVLRPTLAVARFITFAALALERQPAARRHLDGGGDAEVEQLVQEVRRYYSFFPLVAGRVLEPFDWRGVHFAEGRWVMLDIYGTHRDPRAWDDPESFRPERFRDWQGDPFTLIPQGGGDHAGGHRCPGEWITIALIGQALRFLTERIRYSVPDQDLSVDLSRMPMLPASGFAITDVELID